MYFNISSSIPKFRNALRQTLLLVSFRKSDQILQFTTLLGFRKQLLEDISTSRFSLHIFYTHTYIYAHMKSENLKVKKKYHQSQNHKIKMLLFHFCYDRVFLSSNSNSVFSWRKKRKINTTMFHQNKFVRRRNLLIRNK